MDTQDLPNTEKGQDPNHPQQGGEIAGETASEHTGLHVNTEGGAAILGDVNLEGGDFVGRDQYKTIITEEVAYDVNQLPNPYLGLRSFTYEDQEAYAGRMTSLRVALAKLEDQGDRPAMLFITGASGSGKSSFAQAKLLPALVAYYKERQKQVRRPVTFRPLEKPLANFADALLRAGFPSVDLQMLSSLTPQDLGRFLADHTPSESVNLIVLDQFEELYTQAVSEQQLKMMGFLASWSPINLARTQLIVTLRSDFLDKVYEEPALWEIAKDAVELRKMPEDELKAAILAPLEARCKTDPRYCLKKFEPELLKVLAQDAGEKDTYLPLLQLTLEDLWNRGKLTLGQYHGLASAIQERADRVHGFKDYDENPPSTPRPQVESQELLNIILDLVEVSLDDNPLRTVRRRREKSALVSASKIVSASEIRSHLVEELAEARLISIETGKDGTENIEMVDLIHESLIYGWKLLGKAIEDKREILRFRVRFEQALAEWMDPKANTKELLTGVRLEEAIELQKKDDIALRGKEAKDYLQQSIAAIEERKRRELERERERIQAVAVSNLLRKELGGLCGGAVGFALAFFVTYWQQSVDPSLLLFITLFHTLPGAVAGLIFVLLSEGARAQLKNQPGWRVFLYAGLGGALAFSVALVLKALISSILDPARLILIAIEGGMWGLAAGAGYAWMETSRIPRWLTLSLVLAASGLTLVFADRLGNAFLRPELVSGIEVNPFSIFIAGILFPLLIFTGAALIKPKSLQRETTRG